MASGHKTTQEYNPVDLLGGNKFTQSSLEGLTQIEKFYYSIQYYCAINEYIFNNFLIGYTLGSSAVFSDVKAFYIKGIKVFPDKSLRMEVKTTNNSFTASEDSSFIFDGEIITENLDQFDKFCILNIDGTEINISFKEWLDDFTSYLEESCFPPIDMAFNQKLFNATIAQIDALYKAELKKRGDVYEQSLLSYIPLIEQKMSNFYDGVLDEYRAQYEDL